MHRRTFLCGFTLGTLATQLISEAQQAGKVHRVGVLSSGSSIPDDLVVASVRAGRHS